MSHPFALRPGTWDEHIFESVVKRNEYRLPEKLRPDDIIVDIGAHIGSFCYAALQRGSDYVYGFEANPANYQAAMRNLGGIGRRLSLYNKAVWRSDKVVQTLRFTPNTDNNAAGHVLLDSGEVEVDVVAFDDVIRRVTQDGRKRVRMLKIDCEGSEFPILLTSRTLHLIQTITGEYHEYGLGDGPQVIPEPAQVDGYPRFTFPVLRDVLERAGFRITAVTPHPDPNTPTGVFWASHAAAPGIVHRLRSRWNRLTQKVPQQEAAN
jgi:FkbM family methyltransferase